MSSEHETHDHAGPHGDDGYGNGPGLLRRAFLAMTGKGRHKPRTLALPAPPFASDPAHSPLETDGSGEGPDTTATTNGGDANRDAPSAASRTQDIEDQLRRVRQVIEENDPLVPPSQRAASRAAAEPEPEVVALSVRLATPMDAATVDADPTHSHRINAAVLAQLPAGARITALVVETPIS